MQPDLRRGYASAAPARNQPVIVDDRSARQALSDVILGKVHGRSLGSRMVAPIAPHAVHRVLMRSTSLLASSPQRTITSPSLRGAL
jgi:hypothetical protein